MSTASEDDGTAQNDTRLQEAFDSAAELSALSDSDDEILAKPRGRKRKRRKNEWTLEHPFDHIGDEILTTIFSFLEPHKKLTARFALVCKHFYAVSRVSPYGSEELLLNALQDPYAKSLWLKSLWPQRGHVSFSQTRKYHRRCYSCKLMDAILGNF